MRILLVNPPQTFYKGSLICCEQMPLGILYIAGVLKKEGFEVEILDALRDSNGFSYCGEKMYYGLSQNDIMRRIRIYKPDIVGISNPYSSQIENAIMVADITKHIDPKIVTIIGGAHPTVAAFDLMQNQASIDICVRGEGEYAMRGLIKKYFIKKEMELQDIPGLVYRNKGIISYSRGPEPIEVLDSLPFPAYEMIDMEKYLSRSYLINLIKNDRLRYSSPFSVRAFEMITSRGCPYNCIFCSVQSVMGKRLRAHSPGYVLEHISYVINKFRVNHIGFNDDNISFDRDRFDAILSGIIDRKLRFTWDCPNGIRADTLDKPLLEKMKEAGCKHIFIAAESGNQDVINKIIKKNLDLLHVEEVLRLCKKIGIKADVYFVLGLPGETLDDMRQTKRLGLKFLLKYNAIPYVFIATPLPGTRLLKVCQEEGYLNIELNSKALSITTQGNAIINTDKFTTEEVNAIFKAFIRDSKIIGRLKNILLLFTDPKLFLKKVYRKLKIINNFNLTMKYLFIVRNKHKHS